MKEKLNSAWETLNFKVNEVEDTRPSYEYIQYTGVFEATVNRVYGTEHKNEVTGNVTTYVTFELIKDGDKMIKCKELYTYTAKKDDKSKGIKKGDTIPSKGYNLVLALIGMTSGKENVTATWSKTVIKEYGKEINARELKSVVGKKINVRTQIVRSIYTNKDGISKANEDTIIDRIFSPDGYSLAEYAEAIEVVKNNPDIALKDAVEAKAIITSGKRPNKPRYKGCSEAEWLELYQMTSEDNNQDVDTFSSDSTVEDIDADLPSLDDDVEETTTTKEEKTEPKKEESKKKYKKYLI